MADEANIREIREKYMRAARKARFEQAISDGSVEQLCQPHRHADRVRINGRKKPALPPGLLPSNHRPASAEHVEPFLLTSLSPRIYSSQKPSVPAKSSTGKVRLPFEPRPKPNQSDLWHHGLTAVEQAFASNYIAPPCLKPPPPTVKAGRPKLTLAIPETPPMPVNNYVEAQRRLEEGGFTSGSSTGNSTANSYGTFNRWDAKQQVLEVRVCVYDRNSYVLKIVVAIAFIFGMGFWFALLGNWN